MREGMGERGRSSEANAPGGERGEGGGGRERGECVCVRERECV